MSKIRQCQHAARHALANRQHRTARTRHDRTRHAPARFCPAPLQPQVALSCRPDPSRIPPGAAARYAEPTPATCRGFAHGRAFPTTTPVESTEKKGQASTRANLKSAPRGKRKLTSRAHASSLFFRSCPAVSTLAFGRGGAETAAGGTNITPRRWHHGGSCQLVRAADRPGFVQILASVRRVFSPPGK